MNSAFVFIKPHAVTEGTKALVKSSLEAKGIQVSEKPARDSEPSLLNPCPLTPPPFISIFHVRDGQRKKKKIQNKTTPTTYLHTSLLSTPTAVFGVSQAADSTVYY